MQNNNINVFLRIKPSSIQKPSISRNSISLNQTTYNFDRIFYKSNQQEIFETSSKDLVNKALQGYNCTIFAYGQTGSGKTYTIQGTKENPGIVPHTLKYIYTKYFCANKIFSGTENPLKNKENFNENLESNRLISVENTTFKMYFIEIYNETIYDLLNPSKSDIIIREDCSKGIYLENVTVYQPKTYEESMSLYTTAVESRRTSSTSFNRQSSRSHCIFTIIIETKKGNVTQYSKLSFVDLAGSERLGTKENLIGFNCNSTSDTNLPVQSINLKETSNINKSLLFLGKVISNLSSISVSQKDKQYIPYRDSKLTHILKDSLGGNTFLVVIGTITPDISYMHNTLNTLYFLGGVKEIGNKPEVNVEVNENIEEMKNEIKKLFLENQELKNQIESINNKEFVNNKDIENLENIQNGNFEEKDVMNCKNIKFEENNFNEIKRVLEKVSEIRKDIFELENLFMESVSKHFESHKNEISKVKKYFKKECDKRNKSLDEIVVKKRKL
ncbi:kinesin [Hamiltosporidium magnivora]|uniref:Kinesin-like protein n=1 Tax=Hamiltosporidium magnivora TaxID=148818 RepID=A0A4Q9L7I2_9MICR|nr:kinesin [Hamiltosporidium magnivora]